MNRKYKDLDVEEGFVGDGWMMWKRCYLKGALISRKKKNAYKISENGTVCVEGMM